MNDVMVNIGNDNYLPKSSFLMVLIPDSQPVKTLISQYRDENRLIDATRNRKTQSVIMFDGKSGPYIVLSVFTPRTISNRFDDAV